MPQNWTRKLPMRQMQSMDNISEPASSLPEDCIDKVFNLITNQNINLYTQRKS